MQFARHAVALMLAGLLLVHCSGKSSPNPGNQDGGGGTGPSRYTVSGDVTGLQGTGLVVRSSAGDEVAIGANGAFAFPTQLDQGAAVTVEVKTQPTNPWQTCTVAGGSITSIGADALVTVTCQVDSFAVGGTVSGLATGEQVVLRNGADTVQVTANGTYAFPTKVASGAGYQVLVDTPPAGKTCTTSPAGSTTMLGADAAVAVVCTVNTVIVSTFTVGGTVSGLTGAGLVLKNGADTLPVSGNGSFAFPTKVANGGPYAATIAAQPGSQTCAIANGTGTVTGAPVTSIAVTCTNVMQVWSAPTTWGGHWPATATMLQHAYFDGTGIVETTGTITWSGSPAGIPRSTFGGFTAERQAAGPFDTGHFFRSDPGTDSALDVQGDMIVCALMKPDLNPSDGPERYIVAKGLQGQDGWVLMQMHEAFCFHYQGTLGPGNNGNPGEWMTWTPTNVGSSGSNGPLNPSYVVVCGGRDGNTIRIAANSAADTLPDPSEQHLADVGSLVPASSRRMTIGGSYDGNPDHAFRGQVYETAVWKEAATPANLQAKMSAILGLQVQQPDGTNLVATYSRPSEGPYVGGFDGKYHTASWHAPRVDPQKGILFGLQGWNRVLQPEALDLWTRSGGAQVLADQLTPPGDNALPDADRVTLPTAGDSIQPALAVPLSFEPADALVGQIWIQPVAPAAGTLRVRATTGSGQQGIVLGSLFPGWNRVSLSGFRADASGQFGIVLENAGSTPVDFYAWGVSITHLGGSFEPGPFDPGPTLYTIGSDNAYDVDVLSLPPLKGSTAGEGYCLMALAEPPSALGWDVAVGRPRVIVEWQSADGTASSDLHLHESDVGRLCMNTRNASGTWYICSQDPMPSSGSHSVKGCITPSGAMALLVDGAPVPAYTGALDGAPPSVFVPDLATGHLNVGNTGMSNRPFHGYVKEVRACRGSDPDGCRP